MVREFLDRAKRPLRREPTFRNVRKTPKFQRINGWDTTPPATDVVDIVGWVNLQGALHTKKECKKLKISEEDLQFRHVPKRRCPNLEDEQSFEKHSLHRNLFLREKEDLTKPKRAKTTLNIVPTNPTPAIPPSTVQTPIKPTPAPVTTTRPFTFRTEQLKESRKQELLHKQKISSLLRSKTQDDMKLFLQSDEQEHDFLIQSCFPSKRSRSVPIIQSIAASEAQNGQIPSSFRRLLYYARKYGSREYIIHAEEEAEDEGYGSKTPSNDEKDIANLFNEVLDLEGSNSANVKNSAPKAKSKLAKFSYTHQLAKSQLYEESEDEKVAPIEDFSNSKIKYYKTGYVDTKDGELVKRMLNRAYTSVGSHFDGMYRLDGVKPPVTLRRISIQDSSGDTGSYANKTSASSNEKRDMYEPQRTIVRQNSIAETDRTQYPVYCTTPELKFNTNPSPQERPSSKNSTRGGTNNESGRRSATGKRGPTPGKTSQTTRASNELLRRTKSNCFELYRAHTSVCMPIGDLLPAVDRSIKSKTKSRQSIPVPPSVPELPTSVLTPRQTEDILTPTSIEYTLLPSSKTSTPRKTLAETSSPEYAQKKNYSILNTLSPSLSQGSPRDVRTRFSGPQDRQGIRYTSNPDKDTKKKLRDAFSRFYNKQPYGGSPDKRSWSEELKFVWNS